jgi:uncharacterized protein YodC (DUF2158 family)
MSEEEFDLQPGDIVELLSGGPKMTVKETTYDGEVICQWFSGKKLESGVFNPASIKLFDDNSDGD